MTAPVLAEIVDVERRTWGALLTLAAAEVAGAATPGSFVMVSIDPGVSLLRRPYWIADADDEGLQLAVGVVGPRSAWLAGRQPGDQLDLLGPLGRGFRLPAAPTRCAVLGDDAPLGYLARTLRAAGHELVDLGNDPQLVFTARELPAVDVPCQVALEPVMACGIGLCWGCAVEQDSGYVRGCMDGPVFEIAPADAP